MELVLVQWRIQRSCAQCISIDTAPRSFAANAALPADPIRLEDLRLTRGKELTLL